MSMNHKVAAHRLRSLADEAARTLRDESVDAATWALLVEVTELLRVRAGEIEAGS